MNILILHQMGNPKRWVKAVEDLELGLVKYAPHNNYIVHNTIFKFPDFLKDFPFDGIILNSTFLDARHQRKRLKRIQKDYNFIKSSSAIKIALAQDDYDCNHELDTWMVEWNVDYFYSVVHEFSKELFPLYHKKKGRVIKGYTGYISSDFIDLAMNIKPFKKRNIDVGYRATDVVTNLNKLVILKAQIGKIFMEKFKNFSIKLDISSRNEDRIFGSDWFDFVQDCKFMLGTNSGSSLIISDLDFKEAIQEFMSKNKNWKYSEIKLKFFPRQKENISYTAISPRNIEAALLETCQINTTLGNYSGLLNPWEHFIPLNENCDNYLEVFDAMNDLKFVNKIIKNAKESILSYPELRLNNFLNDLLLKIKENPNYKKYDSKINNFSIIQYKYQNYIRPLENVAWLKDLVKDKIKNIINYKTRGTRIT